MDREEKLISQLIATANALKDEHEMRKHAAEELRKTCRDCTNWVGSPVFLETRCLGGPGHMPQSGTADAVGCSYFVDQMSTCVFWIRELYRTTGRCDCWMHEEIR